MVSNDSVEVKKFKRILAFVNNELGASEQELDDQHKGYLWLVSGTVVGVLLCASIQKAYHVIPEKDQSNLKFSE